MSRLEEECIVYVGRNRSGIDAGEIDYGIFSSKFDRQDPGSLRDIIRSLKYLADRCAERIEEIEACDHKECKIIPAECRFNVYQCVKCNFHNNWEPFDGSKVLNPEKRKEL